MVGCHDDRRAIDLDGVAESTRPNLTIALTGQGRCARCGTLWMASARVGQTIWATAVPRHQASTRMRACEGDPRDLFSLRVSEWMASPCMDGRVKGEG